MTQYLIRKARMAALKVERDQKDQDLADALRVSVVSMRRYINGQTMTYPAAKLLADHLQVPMSDLYDEEHVPAPERKHPAVAAAQKVVSESPEQAFVNKHNLPGATSKRGARTA